MATEQSGGPATSWTVRFRFQGTSKQLHGLQPSEPLSALLSRIAEATGVPATSLALRAGFPPQPLATAGAATTQSLTAAGLHDCETLIVQDTRTESSGANALGASPTRARHQSNQAATTEGADGLAAAAAAAIDAGEDWQATAGEQLVMAAAGREAEVGDVLRNFRQSLHTALIERQQQRLANQRLAAALANDFTMETTVGEQRLSGARPALAVTFAAGGRKKHTDTVDIIAPPLLKAIIAHIAQHPEQRENLRPFNMALFSPRVFWNLVRFNEGGIDLEVALNKICPEADWSFLAARVRNLSEKALESRRQAEVFDEDFAEADAADAEYYDDSGQRKKRRKRTSKSAAGSKPADAATKPDG